MTVISQIQAAITVLANGIKSVEAAGVVGTLPEALPALTVVAEDDIVFVHDISADVTNKMTFANLRTLLARQGLPITNTVAADVNAPTTTAVDVTGLAWSVVSGRRYSLRISGTFRSAATTTGIGFNFTHPTMTTERMRVKIRQAANGTDAYFEGDGPMNTNIQSTAALAAATDYFFEVEAQFTPSANGTVQLQTRSEVASSQVTVRAGTTGTLIDVTGTV